MPASTRSSSSRLREREERRRCKRVERDVHPPQSGARPDRGRASGSLTPLVVSARSTPSGREQRDETGDVGPHERLAAGQADGLEPEALDADPGDTGDLLVGEQLVRGSQSMPSSGMQ